MAVEDYNKRVIGAMERAQLGLGLRSAAAFARRLASRSGGPPDTSTYQRWLRGDSIIPAWALLAAAEEAEQSVDALLGAGDLDAGRLSRLEATIGSLAAQMKEVRQQMGLTPAPTDPDPALTPDPRPSVALAVIVNKGKALMTRRRFREGPFQWNFLSGEIEPGETPEQAAVREVHEEVGLQVAVEQRLGDRIQPVSNRHMVYLICRVIAGDAQLVDHEENVEVAWCSLDEVYDRLRPLAEIPDGLYKPLFEYLAQTLVSA